MLLEGAFIGWGRPLLFEILLSSLCDDAAAAAAVKDKPVVVERPSIRHYFS